MTMTNEYVQEVIDQTREQIKLLEQKIEKTDDPREKRKLKRQLKHHQHIQLQYLGKLG